MSAMASFSVKHENGQITIDSQTRKPIYCRFQENSKVKNKKVKIILVAKWRSGRLHTHANFTHKK